MSPRRRLRRWVFGVGVLILVSAETAFLIPWKYAYVPDDADVLNPTPAATDQAFDVWSRRISRAEADVLRKTDEGRRLISPALGAAPTDEETLGLGRRAFYAETFGDEVFLSAVLGAMSGPVRFPAVARALWDLGGDGATNLRVRLSESAKVGGREFGVGEWIDTGLDVPVGAFSPLEMKVTYSFGRLRMGMTCAACRSTVDPVSKTVIHGAPNADLNVGLLLALATDSAAFFPHAELSESESRPQAGGTPSRPTVRPPCSPTPRLSRRWSTPSFFSGLRVISTR